jgi:hypothetical protein
MPLTQSREVAKLQSFYGFFFAALRRCVSIQRVNYAEDSMKDARDAGRL